MHPDVDAAVFETARGGLLREGLAYDRCDVAVVTNIGMGDHLGLSYINTVEDLAVLKSVIVRNVAPRGMAVLNAADPMVARMADACPGDVTFFAMDIAHPVLATHRAKGKRVVYVDGGNIVTCHGGNQTRYALAAIPLTRGGSIGFQVENAMAAIGAAWALNLDPATIRAGLATFVNDAGTAPGRFNVFDYRGATVIADYGHNPDAIAALAQAVETMPARRRSVVISGAGTVVTRISAVRHRSLAMRSTTCCSTRISVSAAARRRSAGSVARRSGRRATGQPHRRDSRRVRGHRHGARAPATRRSLPDSHRSGRRRPRAPLGTCGAGEFLNTLSHR